MKIKITKSTDEFYNAGDVFEADAAKGAEGNTRYWFSIINPKDNRRRIYLSIPCTDAVEVI